MPGPAETASNATERRPGSPRPAPESGVRVEVALLDQLMELVAELVYARNRLGLLASGRHERQLVSVAQRVNLITSQLQERVMAARMQPVEVAWSGLRGLVEARSAALGQRIDIDLEGGDTPIDCRIVATVREAVEDLVRQRCEQRAAIAGTRPVSEEEPEARLHVRASSDGGQVTIAIADTLVREDVVASPETASLADSVANAAARIEGIGGVVDVAGDPSNGTRVTITIPPALAIVPALVVTAAGQRFALPQANLEELIRLEGESLDRIEWVQGSPLLRRRGALLPLVGLAETLELENASARKAEVANVVVLRCDGGEYGLMVDQVDDSQEIVVSPLDRQLKPLRVYSGATILGDGSVSLILDVRGVAARMRVLSSKAREADDGPRSSEESQTRSDNERLLVVRAGTWERLALPLSRVDRLEEIARDSVEWAGGRPVVQYRGGLLTLVPVEWILGGQAPGRQRFDERLQVVVVSTADRPAGLVVGGFVDISEGHVSAWEEARTKGLVGTAVFGGRVTDILDLDWVLGCADAETVSLSS